MFFLFITTIDHKHFTTLIFIHLTTSHFQTYYVLLPHSHKRMEQINWKNFMTFVKCISICSIIVTSSLCNGETWTQRLIHNKAFYVIIFWNPTQHFIIMIHRDSHPMYCPLGVIGLESFVLPSINDMINQNITGFTIEPWNFLSLCG